MTTNRKEEVREQVIEAINSMASHFFYVEIDVESEEEAKYAASLWPRSEIKTARPRWPSVSVGFRP